MSGVAVFVLPVEGVKLDDVECSLLRQALTRTRGNQSAAARLLGVTRYAFRYRCEKHAIDMHAIEVESAMRSTSEAEGA